MAAPDGTERRNDIPSRRRIERLEKRYRRVSEILVAMLVVTLAAVSVGFWWLGRQNHRIQASRREAIANTCTARNQDRQGIVTFVATVAPSLKPRAARTFPLVSDCDAYARRLVEEAP